MPIKRIKNLWKPLMLIRSPFTRREFEGKYQPSMMDSDISFVSSGRPSVDIMFPSFHDNVDLPRLSLNSEYEESRISFVTSCSSDKQSIDIGSSYASFSSNSLESGRQSCSLSSQVSSFSPVITYQHMIKFFHLFKLKSDRTRLKPRWEGWKWS